MVAFRGSTQEKSTLEIFGFGYRKAGNDLAAAGVPDPVGSAVLYYKNSPNETKIIIWRPSP
jgi:hypothetical protein